MFHKSVFHVKYCHYLISHLFFSIDIQPRKPIPSDSGIFCIKTYTVSHCILSSLHFCVFSHVEFLLDFVPHFCMVYSSHDVLEQYDLVPFEKNLFSKRKGFFCEKWAKCSNAEVYADAGFVLCRKFAPNLLNVVKLSACGEFVLRFLRAFVVLISLTAFHHCILVRISDLEMKVLNSTDQSRASNVNSKGICCISWKLPK